ncbi:MAG: phenylacetate--CoA ligase family protein, partial [Dehalococcoidia bacterium]
IAFWLGHYGAEKLGCEIVPGGGIDTRGRISKMREVRATATMNTPTYGLRMAEVAHEMGIDPVKDLQVRKMFCAGEPMPEPTRLELERLWGADVYDHIGAAEVGGWAAMCTEKQGQHVLEPFFMLEVLDLETTSRPVSPGERGIAVVTNFNRRSFPCIRYNLKDMVTLSGRECPCGRTFQMIESISGRMDHLTKIRGVLFSPVSVEEVIREKFPQIAEFETVVTRPKTQDELLIKVETSPTLSPQELQDLQSRLTEELRLKTDLSFKVEFAPPQTLPRYELKSDRFKDLRKG